MHIYRLEQLEYMQSIVDIRGIRVNWDEGRCESGGASFESKMESWRGGALSDIGRER